MKWTAFLQLENCTESTKDNLIAKTSDIWTLPINERLVILCSKILQQFLNSFMYF